jgi:S1-C subfamily serine protease
LISNPARSATYRTTLITLVMSVVALSTSLDSTAQSVDAASLSSAFADASDKCKRSVVSINVGLSRATQKRLRHFGEHLNRMGADIDPDMLPEGSIGSGVIVSDRGHILTNHHVIDDVNEDSILITLHDGRRYFADILGSDPSSDLALLRIYANELEPAIFARAESVRLGELVLAIGSPLGLKFTITSGVISALNRDDWSDNDYSVKRYLQTDAAINPGNSGGGLFRIQGDLVGINTALLSKTGRNIGYGLALTTDLVRAVYDDLADDGLIARPSLGVTARSQSFDSALAFDRARIEETVIIDKVKPGGSADRAGVKSGDIVRSINGTFIKRKDNIVQQMALYRPGQTITFGIGRNGDTLRLQVTLDSMELPFQQRNWSTTRRPYLGASIVTDNASCRLGSVRRFGPCDHAGLQDGDKVVSANGTAVQTSADLDRILSAMKPGDTLQMACERGTSRIAVGVVVGAMHTRR